MAKLNDYPLVHDVNFRKPRLPSLYSDFRSQETLNPDGYRANVSAWCLALSGLAFNGVLSHNGSNSSILVLEANESLRTSLKSEQFGLPLALGAVIDEATKMKEMIPMQNFLQSQDSIYQRSWSEVPWNLMNWALRQVGVLDPNRREDRIPSGQYVLVKNVEAASKELAAKISETTSRYDRVFSKAVFYATFAPTLIRGQMLSEIDMEVLLKFLARDKRIIVYDGQTIRVLCAGDHSKVTEEDTSIASIKELKRNLQHQVDLLDQRVNNLDREARSAIMRKNRVAALAALKAKRLTESSLSTRYATLHQLEEVSSKLEQASDHVQLVRIMEASAGTLRSLNAEVVGPDEVERAIDRLRDQMGQADEVAAILAESTTVVVDESEIDEEVTTLEKEEKEKREEEQRIRENVIHTDFEAREAAQSLRKLSDIPAVPTNLPIESAQNQTANPETEVAELSLET